MLRIAPPLVGEALALRNALRVPLYAKGPTIRGLSSVCETEGWIRDIDADIEEQKWQNEQPKKTTKPVRPQLGDGVEILNAGSVLEDPITSTLETNYMPYAMSVIVSRALPEIDGFKPAHRKLLYTMYEMGLLKGNRTKSANIVGSTMHLNPRRRCRDLRHDGPHGPLQREPACALRGLQG